MLVDVATLRDDFSAMSVLHSQELEMQLAEGRYHRGPAVVTQFVATCKPMAAPPIESCRAPIPLVSKPPAKRAGVIKKADTKVTIVVMRVFRFQIHIARCSKLE